MIHIDQKDFDTVFRETVITVVFSNKKLYYFNGHLLQIISQCFEFMAFIFF